MRSVYIIALASLSLMVQCSNNKEQNGHHQSLPILTILPKANSLIGVWQYSKSIYDSAELILKEEGTFSYHSQNCYGQIFTRGKWKKTNGAILLTSDSSYKPAIEELVERKAKDVHLKSGEVVFTGLEEMKLHALAGLKDTTMVYFDNIQLDLKYDTLYCISNNNYLQGEKFGRAKVNY